MSNDLKNKNKKKQFNPSDSRYMTPEQEQIVNMILKSNSMKTGKDVSKYFDNINKNILLKILERKIKDKNLLWLKKENLFAQKRVKELKIGKYATKY